MATHSSNVAIKRRLPEAIGYGIDCKGGLILSYCTLTWSIPRPFNLKNGVLYGTEKSGVVVTLTRNRCSFTFRLTTKYNPFDISCYVIHDETHRSEYFYPRESSTGVFEIECNNILKDDNNRLLKEGTLKLEFQFGYRHARKAHVCPTTGIWGSLNRNSNQTRLFDSQKGIKFTKAPRHYNFEDFMLTVEDEKFTTHKALLAARSPFFRLFFKENCTSKEFNVDTTCTALIDVATYMYSGLLILSCTDNALQVRNLAMQFKLRNLVKLCELWLKEKSIAG